MSPSRREFLRAGAALGAALGGCAGPMAVPARGAVMIPLRDGGPPFAATRIFRCSRADPAAGNDGVFVFTEATPDAIHFDSPGTTVDLHYPPAAREYRPRIEVVACIGREGADIAIDRALDPVLGYAAGIDGIIGAIVPRERAALDRGRPWLKVNGRLSQSGDLETTQAVARQLAALSRAHALRPGDLVFCATPGSSRAVIKGDVLTGHVEGIDDISVRVV